jgi:MOSC domain-containing protein YiiM
MVQQMGLNKKLGNILEIFSAAKGYKSGVRPKVEKLHFIKDHGIENDKFAGKNLDRTVMIVGTKAYDLAGQNGIDMQYGTLGENILFDFDPHELEIGTIITIGEVKLQITENCTVCSHLSVIKKDLPYLIKEHRGVYCRIIQSGKIDKSAIPFI